MLSRAATLSTVLASLASAALAQSSMQAPAAAPEPQVVEVPDASSALHGALENLCPWFLSGKGYSLPATREHAAQVGFHRGSSARYFPAGPSPTGASVAIGFTFLAKDVQTSGKAVVAFLAFDPTACQVQVFGDADAVRQYKTELSRGGWQVVGPPGVLGKFSVTKYKGRPAGSNYDVQLVFAEPSDPNLPPKSIKAVINMLPLPADAH